MTFEVRYEGSKLWYLRRSISRDIRNLLRYGTNAPRWCQRIWVDPSRCLSYVEGYGRSYTGQVIDGDWDLNQLPLESHPKIAACIAHWNEGISWEATGIFDWFAYKLAKQGSFDSCETMDDVRQRYRNLDLIFEQVRHEQRLRSVKEVEERTFRERRGIYVHVGRDTSPIFGNGGCHRFAMAFVLELPEFPAQLGIVHLDSLSDWKRRFERF